MVGFVNQCSEDRLFWQNFVNTALHQLPTQISLIKQKFYSLEHTIHAGT